MEGEEGCRARHTEAFPDLGAAVIVILGRFL